MIISIIKSFHAALASQENAAHDRKAQLRNISPPCWRTYMCPQGREDLPFGELPLNLGGFEKKVMRYADWF
jgi:hypothetical protein